MNLFQILLQELNPNTPYNKKDMDFILHIINIPFKQLN